MSSLNQKCYCECGKSEFTVKAKPLMRIFCHCEICQAFNKADYADVTVFLAKDISFNPSQHVTFETYKSPPAVDRGKCNLCDKPLIEFFNLPLFPSLSIVPSKNIEEGEFLPKASAHIFYHRRKKDIDDELPKYFGFIRSQLGFITKLFLGWVRKNAS